MNHLSNPLIDGAVRSVTGINPDELCAKCRKRENVMILHISLFFYLKAGYGLTEAAERFNRDHATAWHARRNIKKYYGQPSEKRLTKYVDEIGSLTRINIEL